MTVPAQSAFQMPDQAELSAGQLCWRMLCDVSPVVALSHLDTILVVGADRSAHIAALARQIVQAQFPDNVEAISQNDGARMLWVSGLADWEMVRHCLQARSLDHCLFWDVVVIHHAAADAMALVSHMDGYARVAARRHAHGAVSVFGRGLARDLFRSATKTLPTVRLVANNLVDLVRDI